MMSSSQRSSNSGGVRNLRAMFENKTDESNTSPPSRGRSPGSVTSNGSKTPRPLSKVRANFVAVERNGQLGLQLGSKKTVGESSAGSNQIPSNINEGNDRQLTAEDIARKENIALKENESEKNDSILAETTKPAVTTPSVDESKSLEFEKLGSNGPKRKDSASVVAKTPDDSLMKALPAAKNHIPESHPADSTNASAVAKDLTLGNKTEQTKISDLEIAAEVPLPA